MEEVAASVRSEDGALLAVAAGGEETWIGRGSFRVSSKLQQQCSRRQACIFCRDGRFFLRCHGRNPSYFARCQSMNFTAEDSSRLYAVSQGDEVMLTNGDQFYFTRTECLLTFLVQEPAASSKQLTDIKAPLACAEEAAVSSEKPKCIEAAEPVCSASPANDVLIADESCILLETDARQLIEENTITIEDSDDRQRVTIKKESDAERGMSSYDHTVPRSVDLPGPIPGMDNVIVTITGYTGINRTKLVTLINICGAVYSGELSSGHTHIVCWKFSGKKHCFAKRWGTVITVNHQWFEHSLEAGFRLPEEPYTHECGQALGPVNCKYEQHVPTASSSKARKPLTRSSIENEDPSIAMGNAGRGEEVSPATKYGSLRIQTGKRKAISQKPSATGIARRFKQKKLDFCIQVSPRAAVVLPPPEQATPRAEIVLPPDHFSAAENFDTVPDVSIAEAGTAEVMETTVIMETTVMSSNGVACAICFSDCQASAQGLLPCGHDFCFHCIESWSRHQSKSETPTCPLCKAPFEFITKREALENGSATKLFSETVVMTRKEPKFPLVPKCIVCGGVDTQELMLECGSCSARAVHTFCLIPGRQMALYPWWCNQCVEHRGLYR